MDSRFIRNVILKALGLFITCNLIFALWQPAGLGRISIYNHLVAGRERFPFGENPAQAYNLSLFNLDAMFASHVIESRAKTADEYRVILIGDSSVWGILLRPDETLAGQLNAADLKTCAGRSIRVYNLGYPTISLTKDLMVLDAATSSTPDLIVWAVTLEAFPLDKQLSSPIVAHNAARIQALIGKYRLDLDPHDPQLIQPGWWDRTIIGQRRDLADLFRLQMYGLLWAATGVDQTYPGDYPRAQTDFDADVSFHGIQPPQLEESGLAFDVLEAGLRAAGKTPLLLVNEPVLVSTGRNSSLRYDFFYPRWAYDQYRQMMSARAGSNGWNYLDLWDIVPPTEFTNSAIHLTPAGETLLAEQVGKSILQMSCP